MAMGTIWTCYHLALIACIISYKKWGQREKCLINNSLLYSENKQYLSHKYYKL